MQRFVLICGLTSTITGNIMRTNEFTHDRILSSLASSRQKIRQLGVKKLGLFGSFARDQNTEESDVDFLVEFEAGKKNYDNFIELAFFLEELFNRKIELVTPESISPYLRPYITREVQYADLDA